MKFGGSSLKDPDSLHHIAEIIKENSFSRRAVVLSAVGGITDLLVQAIHNALEKDQSISDSLEAIHAVHLPLLQEGIPDATFRKESAKRMDDLLYRLKRLLKGVAYTGEATQRTRDHILSIGERMSVHIMAGSLKSMGVKAQGIESDGIGMIANGYWGHGTVNQQLARKMIPNYLMPLFKKETIPVITGFFGCTEEGDPITFGRGGSDYSAAIIADALGAERLEVWKDVDGFLTGSPEMVEDSQFLNSLSYDETAELSYFGAKILHPRTVEPLRERKIPLVIRNTFRPEGVGTWVGSNGVSRKGIVKSVTYDRNVALLRLIGPDVGYTLELLPTLVFQLSQMEVAVRSIFSSQTCITLLLNQEDIQRTVKHLESSPLRGIERIEPFESISLVAIVGEGLSDAEGLVARVITNLVQAGKHVEMIVTGASKVAAYFIIREDELASVVRTVHQTFFGHENTDDCMQKEWEKEDGKNV